MNTLKDPQQLPEASAKHRINHACESCRAKRARCSGGKPVCQRCQQLSVKCQYGFARGSRRKDFLAALDEQAEGHEYNPGSAVFDQPYDRFAVPLLERTKIEAEDVDKPYTDVKSEMAAEGEEDATVEQALHDGEDGVVEATTESGDKSTTTLVKQPLASAGGNRSERGPSTSTEKSTGSSQTAIDPLRKTRISSACLYCKRKRRKCAGGSPCLNCVANKTECVFDRSQDRRSKAYFHKKVVDGALGAMQSENSEEVFKLLRENAHFDDVASGIESALQFAEQSTDSSGNTPSMGSISSFSGQERNTSEGPLPRKCTEYCGLSKSSSRLAHWYPADTQQRQSALLEGPAYLILPHIIADDSPLSRAYTNFRTGVHRMLHTGVPLSTILGPLDPDVSLLFRPRQPSDLFTASTWACEYGRLFSSLDIFTGLANIFLLARYMRWTLHPTFENFTMLPAIMRPTLTQQTVPHYASADLYSLPFIRDALIRGQTTLSASLGAQSVKGIKLSWPFDLATAVDQDSNTGATTISRFFGEFASDQHNWSCSRDFMASFPEAIPYLNLVEHDHEWG